MTHVVSGPLTVATITQTEHLDFLRRQRSASFLQTPAWGRVKTEWRAESLGWRDRDGMLVGTGLVLHRGLPRVPDRFQRSLAYLPEGPVLDWSTPDLAAWLRPMVAHLKKGGAFGIRMGPPVVTRRWSAAQVKEGIADEGIRSLTQLPPTERSQNGARVVSQLHELGWRLQGAEGGFAAGQPRYNFQIPLVAPHSDTDPASAEQVEESVLKGMNQLWRRNIKKAAKSGVEVRRADLGRLPAGEIGSHPDLRAFHDLYVLTAERDHFTPRPLSYFATMAGEMLAEEPDRFRLHLAHHEGDLVAATIAIRVGEHAWYAYGASSTEKREVRGSNAVQWQMIRDAIAAGATVYDLRGITDTLDPTDSHVGLIQFKVGTGGEAVEYAGEWDLPVNRPLYKAFETYLRRRG